MEFKRLSSKRHDVIEIIDRFGAITIAQLNRCLPFGRKTVYRAKTQGIDLGYVHERHYGLRKLVAITDQGAKYIGRNFKGVSLTKDDMYHQLVSNEVLIKYLRRYRDERGYKVDFQTERDIITELQLSLPLSELKKPNRMKYLQREIPDFVLKVDGKVLAFEIELSRKTNKRIEEKLRKYKVNSSYDAVYYVCGNDTIRRSVSRINDYLHAGMKFLMLENVINAEEV